MPVKKKSVSQKSSLIPLFFIFIFLALVTVIVLEYLDFQKGKESFIFQKIIPLEKKSEEALEIQRLNKKLISFLKNNHIKFNYFIDEENLYHFKMDTLHPDIKRIVAGIEKIIAGFNFTLHLSEVQKKPDKIVHLYQAKKNNKVTHVFLMAGEIEVKTITPEKKESQLPKIAFIIDDIGNRQGMAIELKKMNIPITAAILPDAPYAFDEARQINQYGLQALIHLPMQPKKTNYHPSNQYKVILVDSDVTQIRKIVQRARQVIPHARGLNNHEGSLVTSRREIITRTLKVIKHEGLFFIDSRTAADTVAYDVARELKMKTAFRDVFLDYVKTYSHSMEQIKKLVSIAKKKGTAIAIGHPFETTLQAIRDSIPSIHQLGIEIVFVSRILE